MSVRTTRAMRCSGKSQSPEDGEMCAKGGDDYLDGGAGERARIWIDNKSQSAQHGEKHTANDNEWRIAA